MQGVTILTSEVITKPVYNDAATILLLGAILVFCGIFAYEMIDDVTFSPLVSAVGILLILLSGFFTNEVPTDRNRYKMLIDDTVSLTEFYEKYEIIDRDGRIYITEDIKG